AISYCVEHGILAKFLKRNRSEVVGMLLEEFDVDKYERSLRREGYEEGIEQEKKKMVFRMLSKGMMKEQIADILDVSIEWIVNIEAEQMNQ
ncbi:MAG: hypothetical protein J6B68_02595, partial [Lachnospiraceae bacterium]|nr:hypothetical protein [Lachnospiraceae bacterium]